MPHPGSYELTSPGGGNGDETVTVPGSSVTISEAGGLIPASETALSFDESGLYLDSELGVGLSCGPGHKALLIPSRLSEGESWDLAYPCTLPLPSAPDSQVSFAIRATVTARSAVTIAGENVPVILITYVGAGSEADGQVIEHDTSVDALDPRSGLIVREVGKWSGSPGSGQDTTQFAQAPNVTGESFGAVAPTPTATAAPTPSPSVTPLPAAAVAGTPCRGATFGSDLGPLNAPSNVRVYSTEPAMTIDTSELYQVVLDTDRGDITLCLEPSLAPNTVNVIVTLVRNGFYNGIPFHRVCPNSADLSCSGSFAIAQAGDPNCIGNVSASDCGEGGPGFTFDDETVKGSYTTGCVAMANAGPNTNGSQFFICTGDDSSFLTKSYNLFGVVSDGLNVAQALKKGDVITKATVQEQT